MTDERVKNARAHMARWETKRESALSLFPVIDDLFAVIEDQSRKIKRLEAGR